MRSLACMIKLQILCFLLVLTGLANAAIRPGWEIPFDVPGGKVLREYFEKETSKLEADCLRDVQSKADWERLRPIRPTGESARVHTRSG